MNTTAQSRAFGTSFGGPICGIHLKPIGRPRQDSGKPPAELLAAKCPDYGKPAPQFNDAARTEPISLQVAFIGMPSRRSGGPVGPDESVMSCRSCVHYTVASDTAGAIGWAAPFCRQKGELLLDDRLDGYAKECEHRKANHGGRPLPLSADEVKLLPEYQDGFGRVKLVDILQRRSDDPQLYETDRPVSAGEAKVGIRAWREIQDLEGYGASVMLPIFDREFFPKNERAKIPLIGDDQHPEDYVDHGGFAYALAACWMELDETPAVWGKAGVGKTELLRHMAFLMGLPFTPINITPSSEIDDIVGKMQVSPERGTYFSYGRGPRALISPNVLLVDEPNAGQPDVWFFWRPLLDNSKRVVIDQNEGEIIHRHPSCFMAFSMNPAWDPMNTGISTLADADTSRLMHLFMALPPEQVERQIITKSLTRDGVDEARAKKIVDLVMACAKDLRQLSESGTIPVSWGIRSQIQVARAMRFFKPVRAYRLGVGDSLDEQAKQAILDIVRSRAE